MRARTPDGSIPTSSTRTGPAKWHRRDYDALGSPTAPPNNSNGAAEPPPSISLSAAARYCGGSQLIAGPLDGKLHHAPQVQEDSQCIYESYGFGTTWSNRTRPSSCTRSPSSSDRTVAGSPRYSTPLSTSRWHRVATSAKRLVHTPYSYRATIHRAASGISRIGYRVVMARSAEDDATLVYELEYIQTGRTDDEPTFEGDRTHLR